MKLLSLRYNTYSVTTKRFKKSNRQISKLVWVCFGGCDVALLKYHSVHEREKMLEIVQLDVSKMQNICIRVLLLNFVVAKTLRRNIDTLCLKTMTKFDF